MEQGAWVVGSGPEVADRLARLQDELGIENLTIFPQLPGMTRAVVVDQLERFARDVTPALRSQAATVESASPGRIDVSGTPMSAIEGHQAKTRSSVSPAAG
jgi:alkanesulfonate monooxygenase SsuD/methylene tetrahydromethanopterin reductase-like flavin-dependent oxidoreductase (luciferase family)